jgi:hypothetical protein
LVAARLPVADISVERRRVGPIAFDRDDVEAVPLDQPPRNGRAGAIEFAGPVARLAEQHDARVGIEVEELAERPVVHVRQGLRGASN